MSLDTAQRAVSGHGPSLRSRINNMKIKTQPDRLWQEMIEEWQLCPRRTGITTSGVALPCQRGFSKQETETPIQTAHSLQPDQTATALVQQPVQATFQLKKSVSGAGTSYAPQLERTESMKIFRLL